MTSANSFTPSLPADLKHTNRSQVLNVFFSHDVLSASDISLQVGLSRQTVTKSIQFFLSEGLIVSTGKGASTSTGGKRPELYSLSPHKYFLCLSLWPTEIRVNLYTIGGQRIDCISLQTPLPDSPKAAIDNIGILARALMDKNAVPLENLCAVSLSTSGIINYKTNELKYSSQSPAWGTNVPLAEYLAPHFNPNTPIFLENAGKMTGRPFLLEKSLAGKRALVIFACWGLSSCLIEKGHILSGKNSLIGEIGHMVIDPHDPERCGCGSNGCLERLVSADRLQDMIRTQSASHPSSVLLAKPLAEITILDIFSAAEHLDPLALYLTDYLASTFAASLRNIALIFDPDQVIFQGDFAYASTYFDQQLRTHLRGFQYFPSGGAFDIRYDQRPLDEMDALGSYIALVQYYFHVPEHRIGPGKNLAAES